jgi:hypothetical protein
MNDITYNLDTYRHLLYNAIDNNNNLFSGDVLELSEKLDKIIVEAYKEQLNINNK